MKKIYTITIAFIFLMILNVHGQSQLHILPNWSTTDGTQNMFYRNATKTDASGNVIIAGATINSNGDYDILCTKHNSKGALLWTYQYDGGNNDVATALCLDGSGNIFLTGMSENSSPDIITIKLNSAGSNVWTSFYDDTLGLADGGTDILIASTGKIFVVGSGFNYYGNTDFITLEYSASSGLQLYEANFDGGLNDVPAKIMNNPPNIYVSGVSQLNSTDYKYREVTYNDTLLQMSTITNTGGSTGIDQVMDMKKVNHNVYICGSTPVSGQGEDMCIIKT